MIENCGYNEKKNISSINDCHIENRIEFIHDFIVISPSKKREKSGTVKSICEENCNFQRLCASILGKFPKNVFAAPVVFNKNNIADDCANFRTIFYFCWYDEEIKSKISLPKLVTTTMNLSRSFTSFLQNNQSAFHLLYRNNEKSFLIFCCWSSCKNKVYTPGALVIELLLNNQQEEVYEVLRGFYHANVTNDKHVQYFFF